MTSKAHLRWTFAVTSIALFMVTLGNLVVSGYRTGSGWE